MISNAKSRDDFRPRVTPAGRALASDWLPPANEVWGKVMFLPAPTNNE